MTQVFGNLRTEHTTALFLIEARALAYLSLLTHQPDMNANRFRALSNRLLQGCSEGRNSTWLLGRAEDHPSGILRRMVEDAQARFQSESAQNREQAQETYVHQASAASSVLAEMDQSISALENDFRDTSPGIAERWNQSSNAILRNLPCHTIAEGVDWMNQEVIAPELKPCSELRTGLAAIARTLGPAEQALQREILRTRATAGDRILIASRRGQHWDLNNNALRCEHKAKLATDLRQRRALLLNQFPELYGRDGSCTIDGESTFFYRCLAIAPTSVPIRNVALPLTQGTLSASGGQTRSELMRTRLATSQIRPGTQTLRDSGELSVLLGSIGALCENPSLAPPIAMRSPEVFEHLTHCSDGDPARGELGRIQTELCQRIRTEGTGWCGYRQEVQSAATSQDVLQGVSRVVGASLDLVGCVASTAAVVGTLGGSGSASSLARQALSGIAEGVLSPAALSAATVLTSFQAMQSLQLQDQAMQTQGNAAAGIEERDVGFLIAQASVSARERLFSDLLAGLVVGSALAHPSRVGAGEGISAHALNAHLQSLSAPARQAWFTRARALLMDWVAGHQASPSRESLSQNIRSLSEEALIRALTNRAATSHAQSTVNLAPIRQRLRDGVDLILNHTREMLPGERHTLAHTLDVIAEHLTETQARAIEAAHEIGRPPYTTPQIATKSRILRDAGFDRIQVRALLEGRVSGIPFDAFTGSPAERSAVLADMNRYWIRRRSGLFNGPNGSEFRARLMRFVPESASERANWLRSLGLSDWVYRLFLEERDRHIFADNLIREMNQGEAGGNLIRALSLDAPTVSWAPPSPSLLVSEMQDLLGSVGEGALTGAPGAEFHRRLTKLVPLTFFERTTWLERLGFGDFLTANRELGNGLSNEQFATRIQDLLNSRRSAGRWISALEREIEGTSPRTASPPPRPPRSPPQGGPTIQAITGGGAPTRPIVVRTSEGVFVIRRDTTYLAQIFCKTESGRDYVLQVTNSGTLLGTASNERPIIRVRGDQGARPISPLELQDAIRATR